MKLLFNLLIVVGLLARGYAGAESGLGTIAHMHAKVTPTAPGLLALPPAHANAAPATNPELGHHLDGPQRRWQSNTKRRHAHSHEESTLTSTYVLASTNAQEDAGRAIGSEVGHGHPHRRGDGQSTENLPHQHPLPPGKTHHLHSRPASNHQHATNEAGVVYVAADDTAAAASEALANLRALDGFVFLVAEPAGHARMPGRARFLVHGDAHFDSRVSDPAERPPDC